jgi:hypothetical protein
MRSITFTFLILAFSISCFGQKSEEDILDSIMLQSNLPSTSKLKFINDCNYAKLIADQDITNGEIKILLVGGIGPIEYTTDKDFELRYNVTFHDYGDLAPLRACILNYNFEIFDYLLFEYGKKWKKEIRNDAFGLKECKKKKKN